MSKTFKKPPTVKQKQKRGGINNRLKQLLLAKVALELKFDEENNKLLFQINKFRNQINKKNEKKFLIPELDNSNNADKTPFKIEMKHASDICLKTFQSIINI